MEINFQEVVKEYRRIQGLSVRGFAEKLTEELVNISVSGETISKWENDPNRAPDLYLFFNCITTYTDWRRSFAVDALMALMPQVFKGGVVTFKLPMLFNNKPCPDEKIHGVYRDIKAFEFCPICGSRLVDDSLKTK